MVLSSAAEQAHVPCRTNTASKFTDWSLKLENGATLTGIIYVPTSNGTSSAGSKPLLVAIHGATCCAYKNVDAFGSEYVASTREEGAVVEGAGHAIELSPVNRGWWVRMFGFAIEVDAGLRVRSSEIVKYFLTNISKQIFLQRTALRCARRV